MTQATELPGRAQTDEQKRAIMERVLAVWLRHPELRLGQLINGMGRFGIGSIFYTEDEALIKALEAAP